MSTMRYPTEGRVRRLTSPAQALAAFALSFALSACSSSTPALGRHRPAISVCDRCGACEESIPPTSANHVLGPIDYPDPPPTGGDHNPCWATWGVHHNVVPPENWVHNLEHGGVVLLYRSPAALYSAGAADAGAADARAADAGGDPLSEIDALVEKLPRTLDTQYAALPKSFAVVAWGYRLVSDCVDLDAAADFYAAHFNQAPEDIPSDPSCN